MSIIIHRSLEVVCGNRGCVVVGDQHNRLFYPRGRTVNSKAHHTRWGHVAQYSKGRKYSIGETQRESGIFEAVMKRPKREKPPFIGKSSQNATPMHSDTRESVSCRLDWRTV